MTPVQGIQEPTVRVGYFDMQAEMGLTKHMGGQMATDALSSGPELMRHMGYGIYVGRRASS